MLNRQWVQISVKSHSQLLLWFTSRPSRCSVCCFCHLSVYQHHWLGVDCMLNVKWHLLHLVPLGVIGLRVLLMQERGSGLLVCF